ncbi:hypothetical protein DMI65_23000 [Escherichia coli]|nr:hypothetical protein [Escherichia coli]
MRFVVIIPARYASTRLPGKPLVDINGKPMIVHVLERARRSGAERIIAAATDHEDVARAVKSRWRQSMYDARRSSSQVQNDWRKLSKCAFSDDTVIVNVRGDEPDDPCDNHSSGC